MINNTLLEPFIGESASSFADRLGVLYAQSVNQEHKKTNGQFFTPTEIAQYMGELSTNYNEEIRILDPGCGTCVLSCSLIESLIKKNAKIKIIHLSVYETDTMILPYIEKSIEYLKNILKNENIGFSFDINTTDFILENALILNSTEGLFPEKHELFDIVISNPPYFKLSKDDKRANAGKSILNGQPNIYSIFMGISAMLLKEDGEFIFITPRSYASGSYFKSFRSFFFKFMQIEKVHLFVSRTETFSRDKVLQETVILKCRRKNTIDSNSIVKIYSSQGLKDLMCPEVISFEHNDIINLDTNEKILFLPTNDFEKSIISIFKNWEGNLNKYNIQISTGPVVAFRNNDQIQDNYENGTVFLAPLFWLHNVNQMFLDWPVSKSGKGQYIRISKESHSCLLPNKDYIFLRRFSTKDDKSRLIAAPYFSKYSNAELIGVENKLNYIYRPKGHLEMNEVIGLSALLNSSLFDTFFRIFNGNVNVSATELREITLPPLEIIKEVGNKIIAANDNSLFKTNEIVREIFEHSKCLI